MKSLGESSKSPGDENKDFRNDTLTSNFYDSPDNIFTRNLNKGQMTTQ